MKKSKSKDLIDALNRIREREADSLKEESKTELEAVISQLAEKDDAFENLKRISRFVGVYKLLEEFLQEFGE